MISNSPDPAPGFTGLLIQTYSALLIYECNPALYMSSTSPDSLADSSSWFSVIRGEDRTEQSL